MIMNIEVNIKMIKKMVLENYLLKINMLLKDILKMDNLMKKMLPFVIRIKLFIKVRFKNKNWMVLANLFFQMVTYFKVHF